MHEKIRTLSLFAGIGGIDLGLEATGHFETVQFVEYDPYCQHILKRHWPDVPVWGDVKTFDPDSCGEIDCIVGGYPCQPFSVAGKQKGTQDDRHLWPRMFEIIKHKRPSLILCENVSGHIVLGLDEVLLDLEGEGYSTRTLLIPASAVDANHKRERVWIVAYSNNKGLWSRIGGANTLYEKDGRKWQNNGDGSKSNDEWNNIKATKDEEMDVANANGQRLEGKFRSQLQGVGNGSTISSKTINKDAEDVGQQSRSKEHRQGSIERKLGGILSNGVPSWMDETDIPRVTTNQTGRTQRLKMLGNAVVPQVVYQLGLAMKELWNEV